jgi:hypothetical protein
MLAGAADGLVLIQRILAPAVLQWLGHAEYVPKSASTLGIMQVKPIAGPV